MFIFVIKTLLKFIIHNLSDDSLYFSSTNFLFIINYYFYVRNKQLFIIIINIKFNVRASYNTI